MTSLSEILESASSIHDMDDLTRFRYGIMLLTHSPEYQVPWKIRLKSAFRGGKKVLVSKRIYVSDVSVQLRTAIVARKWAKSLEGFKDVFDKRLGVDVSNMVRRSEVVENMVAKEIPE